MCACDGPHRLDALERARLVDHREVVLRAPGALWAAAVVLVLAREQATGQRAPDQTAEPLILHQRDELALQIPPGDGVVGLHALEARPAAFVGQRQRLHHLPSGHIADAQRADLAGAHQIVERAQGLVERRERVEAVQLVEVDVVELQAAQAGLDLVDDMVSALAAAVGLLAHHAGGLGGDDDLVARQFQRFERMADQRLGLAERVDIGGVDEVDAGVVGLRDLFGHRLLAEAAHDLPEAL